MMYTQLCSRRPKLCFGPVAVSVLLIIVALLSEAANGAAVGREAVVDIAPADGVLFSGGALGPFSPLAVVFTVTNLTDTPVAFTVSGDERASAWLALDVVAGELPADGTIDVTATLSAAAARLLPGTYTAALNFDAAGLDKPVVRQVTLEVSEPGVLVVVPTLFAPVGFEGGPF